MNQRQAMKPLYKVYEKKPKQREPRLVAAYHDLKRALAVSKAPNRYLLFKGTDPQSLITR